ncbi:hypothetical protein HOD61_00535 [archaeon]|jgi:hypothetical protein|nr:hypothetical protein [archaeon]
MNKKAYMKTLEAIIAIVLFLGVITILLSSNKEIETGVPQDMVLIQDTILNTIQENNTLRNYAILLSDFNIDSFISSSIPVGIGYNFTLCDDISSGGYPTSTESEKLYADSLIIVEGEDIAIINLILWRI